MVLLGGAKLMGRSSRHKPKRLAEKLLAIRIKLGLSQAELIEKISCEEIPLYKADISKYESGKSEPPLLILLKYVRLIGVTIDDLADDEIELKLLS